MKISHYKDENTQIKQELLAAKQQLKTIVQKYKLNKLNDIKNKKIIKDQIILPRKRSH